MERGRSGWAGIETWAETGKVTLGWWRQAETEEGSPSGGEREREGAWRLTSGVWVVARGRRD